MKKQNKNQDMMLTNGSTRSDSLNDLYFTYYTIQSPEQVKNLEQNRFITGDADIVHEDNNDDFIDAYDYMVENILSRKIVPPQHVTDFNVGKKPYRIWLWKNKPDLRISGFAERGTDLALITFKKKPRDILLSDFEMYHFVINKWNIFDDEDVYRNINLEREKNSWQDLSDEHKQIIRDSWTLIFEIDYDTVTHNSLQGVTWNINHYEVKNIRYFKAR